MIILLKLKMLTILQIIIPINLIDHADMIIDHLNQQKKNNPELQHQMKNNPELQHQMMMKKYFKNLKTL